MPYPPMGAGEGAQLLATLCRGCSKAYLGQDDVVLARCSEYRASIGVTSSRIRSSFSAQNSLEWMESSNKKPKAIESLAQECF